MVVIPLNTASKLNNIHVGLDRFNPVATEKNVKLIKKEREDDQLVAWRTEGEYWGQLRTVVVTYNPLTATKQRYNFEKKLLRIQGQLFDFQAKVNGRAIHWRRKYMYSLAGRTV